MATNDQHNHKDLKIIYWNTRSFQKRREEIENLLKDIDIFICVESWLMQDINVQFPGFVSFRKDRIQRGGGILILVRNNLAYSERNNITSPCDSVEFCGIHINNISPPLDLFVCYRIPGFVLTQEQWNTIIKNIDPNRNCLLVGDFNAHNLIWNCRYTDTNGSRFLNSITNHDNLFIHNQNTLTHLDTARNLESNIDLVLSTLNISDIINVSVFDETWGSDHYPIFVNINVEKYIYRKKTSE